MSCVNLSRRDWSLFLPSWKSLMHTPSLHSGFVHLVIELRKSLRRRRNKVQKMMNGIRDDVCPRRTEETNIHRYGIFCTFYFVPVTCWKVHYRTFFQLHLIVVLSSVYRLDSFCCFYLFCLIKVGWLELKVRLLHSVKFELLFYCVDVSVVWSASSNWMSYSTALQAPLLSELSFGKTTVKLTN